jgi:hypothetical protein
LNKVERGELVVQNPLLVDQTRRLERAVARVRGSIVFLALFLGGVQLYLSGEFLFSQIILSVSAIIFLWLLLPSRKQ